MAIKISVAKQTAQETIERCIDDGNGLEEKDDIEQWYHNTASQLRCIDTDEKYFEQQFTRIPPPIDLKINTVNLIGARFGQSRNFHCQEPNANAKYAKFLNNKLNQLRGFKNIIPNCIEDKDTSFLSLVSPQQSSPVTVNVNQQNQNGNDNIATIGDGNNYEINNSFSQLEKLSCPQNYIKDAKDIMDLPKTERQQKIASWANKISQWATSISDSVTAIMAIGKILDCMTN